VRELEVVSRRFLVGLTATTPVLADAPVLAHLDINSAQRRVYGIESHVRSILAKTGLRSRTELTRWFLERRLT
jgi:hypothetical protein